MTPLLTAVTPVDAALGVLHGWRTGSQNPVESPLSAFTISGSHVCPPSYEQAQLSASGSDSGLIISKNWVAVECNDEDDSSLDLELGFDPYARLAQGEGKRPLESFPKVEEFYKALSRFDEEHANLQGHAKAIHTITKTLFDIEHDLSEIHEYWMEAGLEDVAHDVVPLLDIGVYAFHRAATLPALTR